MSEKIRLEAGPLDITREVCGVVGRLDIQLAEKMIPRDEITDLTSMVKMLEWQLPILGQEVALAGEILEGDNHGFLAKSKLALPTLIHPTFATKDASVSGIYEGFAVLPVINNSGDRRRRILHKIRMGVDEFFTPSADEVAVTNFRYAPVGSSTLRPLEPVNAHSTSDLYLDEDAENIKGIVLANSDPQMQIMKVGGYINEILRECRQNSGPDFQLVSLANSLLPKGNVASNDYIMEAIGTAGDFGWCGLSSRSKFTYFRAGNLAVLNAYSRSQDAPMNVEVLNYPELYIRGTDKRVTIPVRSIVDLRQ